MTIHTKLFLGLLNLNWQKQTNIQTKRTTTITRKATGTSEKPTAHKFSYVILGYDTCTCTTAYVQISMRRSPTTQNVSDIDFDLSKPLKVNSNGTIEFVVYGCYCYQRLIATHHPTRFLSWDTHLQSLSHFDLDLSRSPSVNSTTWPNSPFHDLAHLRDIGLQNLSDLDFHLSSSIKFIFDGGIELEAAYNMAHTMLILDQPYIWFPASV